MKIVSQTGKMLLLSSELLELSRTIRQYGGEVDEIEKTLYGFSGMEECRRSLLQQKSDIELLTGRVVNLSNALRKIADFYSMAEKRNVSGMEDSLPRHSGAIHGDLFRGSNVRFQVQAILKK